LAWQYNLLGLNVHSEIRLAADTSTVAHFDERCSVRVDPSGASIVGEETELVALLGSGDDGYAVHRAGKALVARFGRDVVIVVEPDQGLLRVTGPAEALAYVVPNAGLALYLIARGHWTLHGSAVGWRQEAHAILGPSKAGKTTVAALLCGAGAQLVTDDTLRVGNSGPSMLCWGGTRRLRLRPSAVEVLKCISGASSRVSEDGRLVVPLPSSERNTWPLASLCFPVISEAVRTPELAPLSRIAALARLSEATRVRGLRERRLLERQFRALSDVVRTVRAFEIRLPWGPPFDRSWGESLLSALPPVVL